MQEEGLKSYPKEIHHSKFLQFNVSQDYNFEMNDNDATDQLQLIYCFMKFQQYIKWWWVL